MNKKAGILLFLFCAVNNYFAQCPVSVAITDTPTGSLCKNTVVNFNATPTNAGVNPTYIWVLNGDTVLNNTPNFSSAVNGAHVELYLIGNSGCTQDTAYASSYINSITLQATYQVIIEECNQPVADVQITNVQGGTEPYSYYLVTDGGQISGADFIEDLPISSYPLVITDSENCVDTSWINVTAIDCPPIIPQEVFTPNEDGFNDKWRINNIEFYPNNKVYIFDRWGQRVFYKEKYDNVDGWDAKYTGTNMPVSTYYYVIELEFEKQDKIVVKGPVSILR